MSVQDFEQQLKKYGFVLDRPVVADGKWHRHWIEGHKRGSQNGAYILNEKNGFVWGTYQDFKAGATINWTGFAGAPSPSPGPVVSGSGISIPVDFERVWNNAGPADPAHPYLVRKAVLPFGIRQARGQLLIPVRRIDEVLTGIQRIAGDGKKRFYKGTKKHSAFHRIGEWEMTILIAEGYATAATLHMATGMCAVVALDAGNLKHVGRVIRDAFPYARLVFAADDDELGRQEALRASELVRGAVLNLDDITKGLK